MHSKRPTKNRRYDSALLFLMYPLNAIRTEHWKPERHQNVSSGAAQEFADIWAILTGAAVIEISLGLNNARRISVTTWMLAIRC